MAEIRIESVLEELDYELKRALEDAVLAVMPNANVDRASLYKAFVRAASRKCNTWQRISDRHVRM